MSVKQCIQWFDEANQNMQSLVCKLKKEGADPETINKLFISCNDQRSLFKRMTSVSMGTLHHLLEELYLDWVNNFISIESFSRHYGVTEDQAKELIAIGKAGNTWK